MIPQASPERTRSDPSPRNFKELALTDDKDVARPVLHVSSPNSGIPAERSPLRPQRLIGGLVRKGTAVYSGVIGPSAEHGDAIGRPSLEHKRQPAVAGAAENRKFRRFGTMHDAGPLLHLDAGCIQTTWEAAVEVTRVVDARLVEQRQDRGPPTPAIVHVVGCGPRRVVHPARREQIVKVVIVVKSQSDLLQIAAALSPASRLTGLLHGGAGNSNAIKTAMIAITTSNSINVNARRSRIMTDSSLEMRNKKNEKRVREPRSIANARVDSSFSEWHRVDGGILPFR